MGYPLQNVLCRYLVFIILYPSIPFLTTISSFVLKDVLHDMLDEVLLQANNWYFDAYIHTTWKVAGIRRGSPKFHPISLCLWMFFWHMNRFWPHLVVCRCIIWMTFTLWDVSCRMPSQICDKIYELNPCVIKIRSGIQWYIHVYKSIWTWEQHENHLYKCRTYNQLHNT